IYREAVATIRAQADLRGVPPDVDQGGGGVSLACGMVDIVRDLGFSAGAGEAGRAALAAGAPILWDARRGAEGIPRARLP
ncbi:precorrin-8X methylmutase, partial [Burkholderia pseudomallei]